MQFFKANFWNYMLKLEAKTNTCVKFYDYTMQFQRYAEQKVNRPMDWRTDGQKAMAKAQLDEQGWAQGSPQLYEGEWKCTP